VSWNSGPSLDGMTVDLDQAGRIWETAREAFARAHARRGILEWAAWWWCGAWVCAVLGVRLGWAWLVDVATGMMWLSAGWARAYRLVRAAA
jgi:hypothetical protein